MVLPRDKGSATQCKMLRQEGEACGPELLAKFSEELVSILLQRHPVYAVTSSLLFSGTLFCSQYVKEECWHSLLQKDAVRVSSEWLCGDWVLSKCCCLLAISILSIAFGRWWET